MNFSSLLRTALFRPGIFLFATLALLALSSPARAQAIDWNGYCSPSAKRAPSMQTTLNFRHPGDLSSEAKP
jgi:hypothetical protein